MESHHASAYCRRQFVYPFENLSSNSSQYVNLTNQDVESLSRFCNEILNLEVEISEMESYSEVTSARESEYSKPMVLIGIYISTATLFCILAMGLDLWYGFRNRKFWFPSKYFSLNAATITVIAVSMKLPVDLSSSMPGMVDQVAKFGGMAFMCTMMSNFMPSLASMDNKSLIANVTGLFILVITIVVNIFIQVRTHVVNPNMFDSFLMNFFRVMVPYIYMGLLLFLLIIQISSAITIPTSKKILEFKYQATSKTILNDQRQQENTTSIVDEVRQHVKRYWIMAETGNPQFVMASNPLSSTTGIICAFSMAMYMSLVWELFMWHKSDQKYESVYKQSMISIVITQTIGIVVGSVAPILRCFTLLSFKSFANQNSKHFLVFKVEKYWTQKLREWKESRISLLSSGPRSRALVHNLKNHILSFCIGFQKVIVVSCKIIGLIPIMVIVCGVFCSYYFKSVKAQLFTPHAASSSDDTNEDLSNYVLLLEDNMKLSEKTMKGILDSMNHLIQNAEKKQHNNLLKLIVTSVAFDGVEMFDNDQIRSLLPIELANSWSLPIISLTCIAITLPNIAKGKVDSLLRSVGEGLLYTHLVEESLNKASKYVNIRRATMTGWHEVEDKCKWLERTLERSAYEGNTPTQIVKSFSDQAEEMLNEFIMSINGELVEESLPWKVIAANSMYRIAQTIMQSINSHIIEEDELFTQLSGMVADILAACLTNMPQLITMRCLENEIEKREARVLVAINLLGRTTEIIKRLETRQLPNMDQDKMGFIDEWRPHLKQP